MRKNGLMIGLTAGLALMLMAAGALMPPRGPADTVIIAVDGEEFARVPLSRPQRVRVDQGDGRVNVIDVTAEGAVMLSSTCRNQLCVDMGPVTLDNWRARPEGSFIVCLPNRVSVELAVSP